MSLPHGPRGCGQPTKNGGPCPQPRLLTGFVTADEQQWPSCCNHQTTKQYVSIRYTDRLADIGAAASVGSVADSYDCEDGATAAGVA